MNSHFPKSLGTIRDDSKKGALAWEHSASPVYRQRGSWPGKWQHRGHFQHFPQDLVTGRIILLPINKKRREAEARLGEKQVSLSIGQERVFSQVQEGSGFLDSVVYSSSTPLGEERRIPLKKRDIM